MDSALLNELFDSLMADINEKKQTDVKSLISGSCPSMEQYRKQTGRIAAFNECINLISEYKKNSEYL